MNLHFFYYILLKLQFLRQKNNNVIILFSGGPDSVFLVLYLLKAFPKLKLKLILINYQKRNSVKYDLIIAKEFAKKYKLILKIFTLKNKINDKVNFQDFARKKRYYYAKKNANKFKTKIIITGHNFNDNFETYRIQQIRKNISDYKGINYLTITFDKFYYWRPILFFKKKEIISFLNKNKINYAVDETNFKNIYLRNKIRNNIKNKYFFKKQYFFLFNWIFNLFCFYKNNLYIKKYNQIIVNNKLNYYLFSKLKRKSKYWILKTWLSNKDINISYSKLSNIIKYFDKNGFINNNKKIKILNNFEIKPIFKKIQ